MSIQPPCFVLPASLIQDDAHYSDVVYKSDDGSAKEWMMKIIIGIFSAKLRPNFPQFGHGIYPLQSSIKFKVASL
jgi:hypothetical protein